MFHHVSVLLHEAVEGLRINPDGTYVDCTVGGGGHSEAILRRLSERGRLIGLDQDQHALEAAGKRLGRLGKQVKLVHANFRHLERVLGELGVQEVDGLLFDLGISSPQVDEGERGFSYHQEAPLDMRMDRTQEVTASQLVNQLGEKELADILFRYGEERFARQIARKIVQARREEPIVTTTQLAEIIKSAIPAAARRSGPHPARRSFQALRIAVNDELGALQDGLEQAVRVLKSGGRIAVITFHSLEDRLCKQYFSSLAKGCHCPPELPVCVCGNQPLLRVVTKKPILPSEEELTENPRARSAKLRLAEKC